VIQRGMSGLNGESRAVDCGRTVIERTQKRVFDGGNFCVLTV
jgi:hypothetical protein